VWIAAKVLSRILMHILLLGGSLKEASRLRQIGELMKEVCHRLFLFGVFLINLINLMFVTNLIGSRLTDCFVDLIVFAGSVICLCNVVLYIKIWWSFAHRLRSSSHESWFLSTFVGSPRWKEVLYSRCETQNHHRTSENSATSTSQTTTPEKTRRSASRTCGRTKAKTGTESAKKSGV
jgi:hypothetical protein